MTKTKVPALTISKEPRRNNFMRDDNQGGPDTYHEGTSFGADGPTFTIRSPSKEKAKESSPGPGHYTPERADSVTKGRF